MTRAGLGEKFVQLIVGHANEVDRAYKGEYENDWVEVCSEKMTWLTETQQVLTAQAEEIRELKAQVKEQKMTLEEFFLHTVGGPRSATQELSWLG